MRISTVAEGAQLEGERKTVTALFADIKGSMELEQDLDPEEARAIVDPALKLMIDAVHRYDGYVVQSTGDGIFALFGAPVAHEDHPQRALYAALRMQEELQRYSATIARARADLRSSSRVGVNTGEVVVRSIQTGEAHTEYTPIGHSDQSRLADADARADRLDRDHRADAEIRRRLLRASSRWADQGQRRQRAGQRLRSNRPRAAAHAAATLSGRGLYEVRRSAARDGRDAARAPSRPRRDMARSSPRSRSPGVGKSRLFHEFKAIAQSGWMVLEAFSVSHGKASAYLPVIDLLHAYFEITSRGR